MPFGGYHKAGWSLKMLLTGKDEVGTSELECGAASFLSLLDHHHDIHDGDRIRSHDRPLPPL